MVAVVPEKRPILRFAIYCYLVLSVALIATSLYTGRRATRLSGREHYLLTTTHVLVDEEVPPDNASDAAFDAAMREAGESTKLPVEKPVFVLGFADATGPVVLGGGAVLTIMAWWSRRRRRARAIGQNPAAKV